MIVRRHKFITECNHYSTAVDKTTFCHSSAVRIGYVGTSLSVCETESDIVLEIQLLEGTIAPELGNIVVTVSTSDQTALGDLSYNTLCTHGTSPVNSINMEIMQDR